MLFLEKKNPVTPSQRHSVLLKKNLLFNGKPLKKSTFFFKNKAGRNNQGKLTVYTQGGGHKKKYRALDFFNDPKIGIIESIEYDPFRTAHIARVYNSSKRTHKYILAPEGLKPGYFINFETNMDSRFKKFRIGSVYPLKELPIGSFVYNLPFFFKNCGKIARSAGNYAQIMSRGDSFCNIKLSSGAHKLFLKETKVSLGIVSNGNHRSINIGKAGRNRWLNRRPRVRGVAMNPVDHPHGGGEGKTSGGRPSVTPWGKPTHNYPTKRK